LHVSLAKLVADKVECLLQPVDDRWD
jgi:hypothetical protein